MAINIYKTLEVLCLSNNQTKKITTDVLNEYHFELSVNNIYCNSFYCTPRCEEELVIGYLFSNGVIRQFNDLKKIVFNDENCHVFTENEATKKHKPHVVKQSSINLNYAQLIEYANAFYAIANKKTVRGLHYAVIYMGNSLLYSAADIGRHNAIDKVIGFCVKNKICMNKCILQTTGRTPLDIVKKVVGAGITVLLSRSVPTYEAVKYAQLCNLTLIGQIEKDYKNITIYTNPL